MGKRMFGPLSGSVVEAFRAELFDQGYRSSSAENVIAVMRDLSRWLSDEGMSPGELTDALLEHFAAARRAGGHRRHLCATQLAPVMEFLRREGLSPPPALPVPTPVSSLVADYRAWLVHERGLAARTVARYEKTAARLLSEHAVVSDGRGVKTLTAGQVRSFLLRDCPALGPGSAKGRAGEVRALLKFLFIVGYTPVPLAAAVPSVAGRRDGSLPRTVGAEVVVSLLASCDRSRATGRRDFAILTLLARLGLRSAEGGGPGPRRHRLAGGGAGRQRQVEAGGSPSHAGRCGRGTGRLPHRRPSRDRQPMRVRAVPGTAHRHPFHDGLDGGAHGV